MSRHDALQIFSGRMVRARPGRRWPHARKQAALSGFSFRSDEAPRACVPAAAQAERNRISTNLTTKTPGGPKIMKGRKADTAGRFREKKRVCNLFFEGRHDAR